MKTRSFTLSTSCALLFSATLVHAELSTNVVITSDYIWRGISQTLGDPAVQGGVDYAHDSGFYAGAWASNVDFFSNNAPGSTPADDDEADLEVDLYFGYYGSTDSGMEWDIGLIQYRYPGAEHTLLDTSEEFYLGGAYDMFSLMVYHDFDNDSTYSEAGLSFDLPQDLNLQLRVGHFNFNDAKDYSDIEIALSRTLWDFDFTIHYTDTDLSGSECADGYWFDDQCDGTVSLTIAKEFEL